MRDDRPNILLITTDQQRFDTIHAAGNRSIFTPHLNWLLRTGVHYRRAYTTCPICVASRVSIMTGLHGHTTGLMSNGAQPQPMDDHPTLPGVLTAAGYQTRAVGKMHFHPPRGHYGFEHMEILEDYYRHMARHPHLGRPMDHGVGQNEMEPVFSTVDESHSLTRWTVERSIDFLETRDSRRPFFMWTSFSKPHPPFDCDEKYWRLYDGVPMPEPARGDWSASAEDVPPGLRQPTFSLNSVHHFSPAQLQNARRAYYACISQIDYNLGVLFARLREMKLLEHTWIIFASDHGEMLGDHWLGAKSIALEGSAHVPLLVRPPSSHNEASRLAGLTCDQLVCLPDIMPTCLNWAGCEPDAASVDGADLMRAAEGQCMHEELVIACGPRYGIVDERHKFIYSPSGNAELLFDLENDPYECRELIRAGDAGPVHQRMRKRMVEVVSRLDPDSVRGGELVGSGEPRSEQQASAHAWPGFHTPHEEADVLH